MWWVLHVMVKGNIDLYLYVWIEEAEQGKDFLLASSLNFHTRRVSRSKL